LTARADPDILAEDLSMADDLLRKALAEQEAELEKLDAELAHFRPLQAKRDNVFHLIAQMRFNLGMEPYHLRETLSAQVAAGPAESPPQRRAIWVVAQEILERSVSPMSAKEIADIMLDLGHTDLVGRPGKETVRSLLTKKRGIFTKLPDGRFELKRPG